MLKLAEQRPSAQISKDEIEKLRKSVLQANRPKNPWSDRESPLPSMNQQNHKMEEKPSLRSPLNVQTVSGEDTMFDARRAQPSIHSLSPASPLSNSTPSSSSSTGGNMKWQTPIKLDSPTETFHARPAAVASLKNGTKIDSNSYQTSTKPQTNHTKVKTYYHGGIPKPKTSDPPRNEAYGHKQYQKIYTQSPKTNYIQNGTSKQSTNFLKPDAKNEKVPSWRQSAVVVQKPPIEVVRSEPKLSPTTMDLKILEELEVESRKRMEILSLSKDAPSMVGQHIVGNCGKCKQQIFDNNNVTFALEKIYHDKCFSCDVCRLPLKGTRFFR
uniref:LIM zinc-binding domain-containing protein n=1 Tax=Acrobeloides nanus TaxID=290746 RepID=A0A914CVM0_9BILA